EAAMAQRMTRGITPGHHLLLQLKSPRIRYPRGAADPSWRHVVASRLPGHTNTMISGPLLSLASLGRCAAANQEPQEPAAPGSREKTNPWQTVKPEMAEPG